MVGPAALFGRPSLTPRGLKWSPRSKVLVEPVSLLGFVKPCRMRRGRRKWRKGKESRDKEMGEKSMGGGKGEKGTRGGRSG